MIRISAQITKTKNPRITFFSDEAKKYLQLYLQHQQEYVDRRNSRSHFDKTDNGRMFLINDINFAKILYSALAHVGLCKRDSTTKRNLIHAHSFRKWFRTNLATAVPVDIVEAMMGHEGYLTEVYRKYGEDQLREFYKKGEYALANLSMPESLERLRFLEEQSKKQNEELEEV